MAGNNNLAISLFCLFSLNYVLTGSVEGKNTIPLIPRPLMQHVVVKPLVLCEKAITNIIINPSSLP